MSIPFNTPFYAGASRGKYDGRADGKGGSLVRGWYFLDAEGRHGPFSRPRSQHSIVWVTTAPNPRSPATGFDAGQRGWRLHAVEGTDADTYQSIRHRPALCGLRPRHGWGLDVFIEDRCARCTKAAASMKTEARP